MVILWKQHIGFLDTLLLRSIFTWWVVARFDRSQFMSLRFKSRQMLLSVLLIISLQLLPKQRKNIVGQSAIANLKNWRYVTSTSQWWIIARIYCLRGGPSSGIIIDFYVCAVFHTKLVNSFFVLVQLTINLMICL